MIKKVLAGVVIIALLAAAGWIYKDYRDQSSTADTLKTQIKNESALYTTTDLKNKALEAEIAEIKAQTVKVEADIAASNKLVPVQVNAHDIIQSILELGSQKQVSVIPMTSKDWAAVKIGTHNYQVFKMSMDVVGQEDRILPFLEDLQDLKYQPMVIESLSLDKPGPVSPIPTTPPPTVPTPTATPTTLTVFTNTATGITETEATLNGNLALMGAYTQAVVQFEWGTTTAYGTKTQTQAMTDEGLFSEDLEGLLPGTTYYFRSIVVGSASAIQPLTRYGNPMSFMTVQPPQPTPQGILTLKIALAVYAQ